MTSEVTPEPHKSKRDELVDALTLDYAGMVMYHKNRAIAERIADRVIQAGWQWHPPKLEPEQEIEIMDRIISGLPIDRAPFIVEEYMEEQGEDLLKKYEGVRLYDVNSLYPTAYALRDPKKTPTLEEAANTWEPVPEFANYQVNTLGEFRNRFTRRILDFEPNCNGKYVEMHDKDGFAHLVSVDHIVKEVFGE
jgi:hypothetical protein